MDDKKGYLSKPHLETGNVTFSRENGKELYTSVCRPNFQGFF
jgi:hypothetical protein